jgi:hypothetical protein
MPANRKCLHLPLAIVLLGASFASADDQDVRSEQQAQEKTLSAYPALPAGPLRQALFFRVENKNLSVYTSLAPTTGISRMQVTDIPGLCTADVHLITPATQPANIPYQPDIFSFVQTVYDLPTSTVSSVTVNLNPMNLQVAYDSESPAGMRSITFVQSAPGMDIDEPAVRLTLSIPEHPTILLTAPDFLTLRRQFPAETTKYLEPIFHRLHADGIAFSTDPKVAWQVFAPDARPDPSIAVKVNQILPRLDSDNFRDREAASADLKKLGQRAAVVLWKIDRSLLSAEQNSRIDAFLTDYQPITENDANRLRADPTFLLECLYNTDEFLVTTALSHLEQIAHHPIPFDRILRDEARREAVNALREKLIPPTTEPTDPR